MAPRNAATTTPAFIQLAKVTGSESRSARNQYNDSDEDTGQVSAPTLSTPVVVATDSIRCYNARKNNAPGTRLTFKDGGGFAVLQTVDAIKAAIGGDVPVLEVPTLAPRPVETRGEAEVADSTTVN